MWPFYMSWHEGLGGGNINTCMLHVLPLGPCFCTVTCILEILSLWWLFFVFFWTATVCECSSCLTEQNWFRVVFFLLFCFVCLFVFFYIQKMWTLSIIYPTKTMVWIIRTLGCDVFREHGLSMDGVQRLFEKWLMTWSLQICGCFRTGCTFVVTMVTGVYLQLSAQSGYGDWLKKNPPCAIHVSQTPSQLHQRGGGLWLRSTFMTYVNTNVKCRSTFCLFIKHGKKKILISCHNTSWYFTVI